jgi:uncharacterized membrane protein
MSSIFLGRQPFPEGGTLAAVHLGQHHGWDGFAFVTIGLLLLYLAWDRKRLAKVPARMLVAGGGAFIIGFGMLAWMEDLLNEQVYKRGIITPCFGVARTLYAIPWLYLIPSVIAVLTCLLLLSVEWKHTRIVASKRGQ